MANGSGADTRRTRRTPADEHARRLAAETLARGETQAVAAKVAGVHVRTLRRWSADPEFAELVAEVAEHAPSAAANEGSEIRRQLWHLAKTGPGTSRIAALKALREMEGSDDGEIDWGAVIASAGECPAGDRDRLLGRLAQLEARQRSTAQLLVARCTGLELDASTAEVAAAAWAKPGPELLEAMGQLGVVAALEQHARGLEQQARDRDRPQATG